MLAYNKLSIYISQYSETDMNSKEPKLCIGSWDFDAISALSHHLSKIKVIGEYSLNSQPDEKGAERNNFIAIGSFAKPDLPKYIYSKIKQSEEYCVIHEKYEGGIENKSCKKQKNCFKGFKNINNNELVFVTQQPKIICCPKCTKIDNNHFDHTKAEVICSISDMKKYTCKLKRNASHFEIAQLILWREDPENIQEHSYFWVVVSGASGPATYALSELLIEKRRKIKNKIDSPFSDLQKEIRKKCMNVFFYNLEKRLCTVELMPGINSYKTKMHLNFVKYSLALYLNTILYKYFFPFLSERDMDCICNGAYMFVIYMQKSKDNTFQKKERNEDEDSKFQISGEKIEEISKIVKDELISVLKSLKGFEVFYLVIIII